MVDVSVIIPTHNRDDLLPRAVHSVLDQTHSSLELIIIDDGSTDETEKTVRQIENEDDRIIYRRNESSIGSAAARNRGLEIASGEYCAFLDDDDVWLPGKIETQLQYADGYSVVGTDSYRVHSDGRGEIEPRKRSDQRSPNAREEKSLQDALAGRKHIPPSALLTRTAHLREVGGFDEELQGSDGYDLNIRLIENFGTGLKLTQKYVIHYVDHGNPRDSKSATHFKGVRSSYNKHRHLMNFGTKRHRLSQINRQRILKHPDRFQRYQALLSSLIYADKHISWAMNLGYNKLRT